MADDIIEKLRTKEEEMETLLLETRKQAAIIKEAAIKRAKELKTAKLIEMEEGLRKASEKEDAVIAAEADAIDKEGQRLALELKAKGERNMDRAVEAAVRSIMGGETP